MKRDSSLLQNAAAGFSEFHAVNFSEFRAITSSGHHYLIRTRKVSQFFYYYSFSQRTYKYDTYSESEQKR